MHGKIKIGCCFRHRDTLTVLKQEFVRDLFMSSPLNWRIIKRFASRNMPGFTLQDVAREYVVTKKQKKPAIISFGGISYQFVQHNACRFFGLSSIWINQFEKAMVSNLEKTIVDMATNPSLCRGIVELGNALFRARDRTDQDKLFYYFARNMNKSAKKRFLFLTDLLGLEWTGEHERMMKELGTGSSLLDPSAPNQGKNIKKFGLKINVDPNHIKKKVEE